MDPVWTKIKAPWLYPVCALNYYVGAQKTASKEEAGIQAEGR